MRLRPGITRRCAPLAAGGPAWIPSSSAGFILWLESDSGLTVSQWTDQSSNANHAVQATGALQPTITANAFGTLPGLTFNGAATYQYMQLTKALSALISAGAYTMLAVLKPITATASSGSSYLNDAFFAEEGGYFGAYIDAGAGTPKSVAGNYTATGDTLRKKDLVGLNQAFLHMQRHAGGNLYSSLNSDAEGAGTASTNTDSLSGAVQIGARATTLGSNSTIGAILVWNVDLDTQNPGDLALAKAYLKAKYGTP